MSNSLRLLFSVQLFIFALFFVGCGGSEGVKKVGHKDNKYPNNLNLDSSTITLTTIPDSTIMPEDELKYTALILTPIERTKVLDYYIEHTLKQEIGSGQHSIFLFDGVKETEFNFAGEYQIEISPNEKYFTLAKLNQLGDRKFEYEVELRNYKNQILVKSTIPACFGEYYDEFMDAIYPMEDGSGFLQEGRRLGDDLLFSVYKIENSKLVKKFTFDKTTNYNYDKRSINCGLQMNEKGTEFLILRKIEKIIRPTKDTKIDSSKYFLEFLTKDGKIQWSKKLTGIEYAIKSSGDYKPYKNGSSFNHLLQWNKMDNTFTLFIYSNEGSQLFRLNDINSNEYYVSDKTTAVLSIDKIFLINGKKVDTLSRWKVMNKNSLLLDSRLSKFVIWKNMIVIGFGENGIFIYDTLKKKMSYYKTSIKGCNIPMISKGELYFSHPSILLDNFNYREYPMIYKPKFD